MQASLAKAFAAVAGLLEGIEEAVEAVFCVKL